MNTIVEACLKSINDINENEFMAEIDACNALLEGYAKAIQLMEYGANDLSFLPVKVFVEEEAPQNPAPANNTQQQNAENNQARQTNATASNNGNKPAWEFQARKDKKNGTGKESLFISIIAFIPRLIIAVVKFIGRSIQNLFSGKKTSDAAAQNICKTLSNQKNVDAIYTDEGLISMLKEAGIEGLPPFKFVKGEYHTGNFANSSITNDANGNPVELNIVVPFKIESVVNNMKTLGSDICDQLIALLNDLTPHRNAEGTVDVSTLKNENVEVFNKKIEAFMTAVKAQNNAIANIEQAQSDYKSLFVNANDGKSGVSVYKPEAIWNQLNILTQIQKLITEKNKKIEEFVNNFERTDNRAVPEEGSIENLKKCVAELKNATELACGQVSKVSSYISKYQSVLVKFDKQLNSGWLPSIFKMKAENNESTALQNSQQNANNIEQDTPAPVPPTTGDSGKKADGKGLPSTDLGRKIPGTGSNAAPENGNGKKPGLWGRLKSVFKKESYDMLIGVDENGNQHEITMEEYNENYSDIEIITEQEYLAYYQFENISSLEY